MRRTIHFLPALLMAALAACGGGSDAPQIAPGGETYKVYFLGGQSNMEGHGKVSDLPGDLRGRVSGAVIFTGKMVGDDRDDGGIGRWAPLSPGFGTGFKTSVRRIQLADRFGPELSFGRAMTERGGEKIAIIKYARGGSSLAEGASAFGTWAPGYGGGDGQNQYDYALSAIETAMATPDIDGDGKADTLIPAGIIWMQGETDAHQDAAVAAAYASNLTDLMSRLRAALGDENLPIVIGQIADSQPGGKMLYEDAVIAAQRSFVADDQCAALVTETEDFTHLPDGWHYQSADYLTLGEAFSKAITGLEVQCS